MATNPTQEVKTLQDHILSGRFVLLSGSGLATAINFAYNIAIVSAVTLSFQIVSAKMVAQQGRLEDKGAAYRSLHRAASACGIFVVQKLQFLCGLSPRMTQCCWYNTRFLTLIRYGRTLLTHMVRNPEEELTRLMQSS